MALPTLFLSHDVGYDYLSAIEYGRVMEGQPAGCWRPLDEDFAFFRPPRMRRDRGFHVRDFSEFDVDDEAVAAIWSGQRFAVPLLGLTNATAGEIIVGARAYFGDEPSINRVYFDAGTKLHGEDAVAVWRCCLESGDLMAHFALGYTLFELERFREAYAHLRRYVDLAPDNAWNWCWYGKAAMAIGERAEARRAFRRALRLTARGGDETDAAEMLGRLD